MGTGMWHFWGHTDDQCTLVRCVSSMPPASAHQCLPVHINATYQCPSELPFSATYQCVSLLPISATYLCESVLPISAIYEVCLSAPISATYQCLISAHQYRLSVPITAASLAHISE
ncbi:unnamed protein product, partial [Staurois parvus]